MTEEYKKLAEMIQDIEIAMMTTQDTDGFLRSRPMMVQEMAEDGSLWFFTSKDSGKMLSIEEEPRVNLAYASPRDSRYVSVSGRAEQVDDLAKKKELWSPKHRAWFSEGVEDPQLTLIRVQIEAAEYWDAKSSKLVHLLGAAKALMTGESVRKEDMGKDSHGKIELH